MGNNESVANNELDSSKYHMRNQNINNLFYGQVTVY